MISKNNTSNDSKESNHAESYVLDTTLQELPDHVFHPHEVSAKNSGSCVTSATRRYIISKSITSRCTGNNYKLIQVTILHVICIRCNCRNGSYIQVLHFLLALQSAVEPLSLSSPHCSQEISQRPKPFVQIL